MELKNKMKNAREYYQLSQNAMSKVCGFGINQWQKYENGKAKPEKSNKTLIKYALQPDGMLHLLKMANESDIQGYETAYQKAQEAIQEIEMKTMRYKHKLLDNFFEYYN